MAQEENSSRCINSSSGGCGGGGCGGGGGGGGGGRSSKKLKRKKAPQRGMGVAQLEKIISEQQQKKDATVFTHNSVLLPPNHHPLIGGGGGGGWCRFTSSMMEPPSNQSYCGKNYQPLWTHEEKMVGIKRSYSFLLDPSFDCKFPSAYESASCSNGGTTSIEPAHPSFRKNRSSSSAISDATTKNFIDENQVLTRDFLKLAPTLASQSNLKEKEKLYLSPQQGQSEDPRLLSRRGGSNLSQFLGFFPTARTPMEQQENNNSKIGENVDLNLKL